MANYTILLIDYEPRSIERFRDPLLAAGYAIEIATDGISGIEAFHRLNPDMVLVEAMIPKKHGFEVCQELKRTPHGRTTPIIITTGVYKGRKYRTQALHIYGCDEYIEKPIAPEQLLELVGKFLKRGPSGTPPKSTERGPSHSESGGGSTPHETSGSNTKATGTKATLSPRALADGDAEDEIMARLDAIMPGSTPSRPNVFAGSHANLAAAAKSIAVIPKELEAIPEEDLFAAIRAELDAELGALPDPIDLDLDAALEAPFRESIPSDQLASPSILEALPIPEAELPIVEAELPIPEAELPIPPLPEPAPILPVERPGQLVDFETKSSRKNKKSKPSKARTIQAELPSAPQPVPIAPPREAPASLTREPLASVAELTLPRGTVVESELDASVSRRGVPVWIWAVAGVIAAVGLYFILFRGTPDRAVASSPSTTPSNDLASAASVPPSAALDPAPQAAAPQIAAPPVAAPQSSEPSAVVTDPPAQIVPSHQPPPPKKQPERPTKSPEVAPKAAPPVATVNTARVEPLPTRSTLRQEPAAAAPAPAAVAPAAPAAPAATGAPTGLGDTDAGVESLPDPAATPATAPGSGALIPIDEADSLPVSLSRQAPVYSEQAKQMRLSGTVIMNLLINEKGTVDHAVLVIGVPGADLNESAIRAAKTWTYRPATKNGVPVKVWKSEQIVFKR